MATTINAGRVAMVPKGDWSASTAYTNLDIVTHNGSSWICVQSNTGNEPASGSSYWQLSAQKGDAGASATRFLVTITYSGGTYSADKTLAQIIAASNAGDIVEVKYSTSYYQLIDLSSESALFGAFGGVTDTLETFQVDAMGVFYNEKMYQQELVSGTNIKTINNQSLLGSGNITVQAKRTYVDNSADASVQLAVTTYNDLGTLSSWKTITLPATYDRADEFIFRFTCNDASLTPTLPSGVVMADNFEWSEMAVGVVYQVSICDGIAAYLVLTPNT